MEYNYISKILGNLKFPAQGGIMDQVQAIEHVKQIKIKYEQQLMSLANVVGLGIGFKQIRGQATESVALVVNVEHKEPVEKLSEQDIIPAELEGVPVDVQEVGKFTAF
jgi:hypothetical protein